MTTGRPPVEPPIIRTRLPAWMHVRDVLLTLGAWLLIGYFLREGLYLAYDYVRAPIFELTTAAAPDWSEVWGRLRGFVLIAATLVVWLTFWALDSRARLQATHSPQPAPLLDSSHAAHFGLTEAELAAGRLAKVQTVDIDPRAADHRHAGRTREFSKLSLPLQATGPCYILNHMVQYSWTGFDASFAAISDATRRGVLEQLGRADASITDLAEKFQMTLTGMKKHVGVLEQAGLVTTEKVGRVRTCKLGLRRLEEEAAWIEKHRQLWDARFDELDKVVEKLKRKEKVDGRKKRK